MTELKENQDFDTLDFVTGSKNIQQFFFNCDNENGYENLSLLPLKVRVF